MLKIFEFSKRFLCIIYLTFVFYRQYMIGKSYIFLYKHSVLKRNFLHPAELQQ